MPEAIMELRHELHSRGASLHADLSGALLEVTRLVATSHAGVLATGNGVGRAEKRSRSQAKGSGHAGTRR